LARQRRCGSSWFALRVSAQCPELQPPFSASCRAMRLHMRGVDHQRGGWAARLGKTDENIFPHTLRRPANKAVVERLARTVATGRVFPPAATLQHMDYAADHTTVVHPRHPSRIARQE